MGLGNVITAAMNQAFFTLSLGIASMEIFGTYISKDRTLGGESVSIVALDTFVAIMAGLIIFPACFSYNVDAGAGPSLIFITLPNIFNNMSGGQVWGTLFFIFMSAAALTTVIAVIENIIAYFMDGFGWSRRKATLVNFVALTLCTLPCILGFNVWSGFEPLGPGTCVLDLEDFIISNNILPLGSFMFMLFCCHRYGWGWDSFVAEADTGTGLKFPKFLRFYLSWILPAVFLFIFVQGYIQKFF
jgi:NSS family neurotransmitter:Na+ symporter